MPYSEFDLERVCRDFSLRPEQNIDLYEGSPEIPISPLLAAILEDFIPLATQIHTEKARSEFIVAPILAEVRKLTGRRVSLFSGIEFSVDPERGLSGFCDFLFAASPVQLFLEAPVLAVVEAKNDNIKSGLGQCVAEMVASRIFNKRAGRGPTEILHGVVTTGSVWKFLRIEGPVVFVDSAEYYLDRLGKILGMLLGCVGEGSP